MIDGNHVNGVRLAGPYARLVRLTMSFNSLTELPVLPDAPKLSLLDVTNNYISVVRDASFTCCRMLRHLCLARNRITSVSVSAFRFLTRLTEIDLADNRLSALPSSLFRACSTLSVLDLSRNRL